MIIIIVAVVLSFTILTGSFYSYWINIKTPPKTNIGVKVVYAYIGHPTINSNIAGLYYNSTQTKSDMNYNLTSYVIILRLTNNGEATSHQQFVSITQIRVDVAPLIVEYKQFLNDSNGQAAHGGLGGSAYEISNAIISDERKALQDEAGWNDYLDAGSSTIVAITGITTTDKFSQQYLQNGTLYIWANIIAQPGYPDAKSIYTPQDQSANDLEQVKFQNIGGDYLFNDLLVQNQTLVINGLNAEVSQK
jgi:hypothetical protein